MDVVQPHELLQWARDTSGLTGYRLGVSIGRSGTWYSAASRNAAPSCDTVARVLHAAGMRLVVEDSATGERLAEIVPNQAS